MQIWLSYNNNKERFMLPVNPEKIEMTAAGQNTKVSVLNLGALNLIGYPDLETITFSSHFPSDQRSYAKYYNLSKYGPVAKVNKATPYQNTVIPPYEYVAKIKSWQQKCFPIRFIVTGTTINHAMAIESFTYGQSGPTKDVVYTLSLTEYRHPDWKQNGTVYEDGITGVSYQRSATKNGIWIYYVFPGDTFASIARKATGDSRNAQAIMDYNGIYDPNALRAGMELIIPNV